MNVLHLSFHTVCLTCGLLQNDNEWHQCLTEAAGMCSGDALCCLLALVLKHCKLVQPWRLWDEFKANLCDDLRHSLQHMDIFNPSNSDVHDYGLFLLNTKLANLGTSLSAFSNMPHIDKDWAHVDENPFLSEQLAYDKTNKLTLANNYLGKLNADQLYTYETILDSVHLQTG